MPAMRNVIDLTTPTLGDRYVALFEFYAAKRAIALRNADVRRPTQPKTCMDECILWDDLMRIIVQLPQTEYKKETGLPAGWTDGCYSGEMNMCLDYARGTMADLTGIRFLCSHVNVFPAAVRAALDIHVRAITGSIDIYSATTPNEARHIYANKIVGTFILQHIGNPAMARVLHDLDNFLMAGLGPATCSGRINEPNFSLEYYLRHVIGTYRDNRDKLVAITAYVLNPPESVGSPTPIPTPTRALARASAVAMPICQPVAAPVVTPSELRAAELESILSARNTKDSIATKYHAHFKVLPQANDTKKRMITMLVASMGEAVLLA